MVAYAHSVPDKPLSGWEPLSKHLRDVSRLAEEFATKFDAGDFGRVAGLLHDLGKAKPEFQAYLRGERSSEPHSSEGALFCQNHYALRCPYPFAAPIGRILAFAIAGHHAGLANGASSGGGTLPLDERLAQAKEMELLSEIGELPKLMRPPAPLIAAKFDPFGWSFFTRMLFSALVDADFLETERWFNEANGAPALRGWSGDLRSLMGALDSYITQTFGKNNDCSALTSLRAEVLADCREAAVQVPGLFSLTVPTGGGKTLSSLAFALNHAEKHGLDRVIYVIPFTSIAEQTADVFRKALGDADAVLEHHSAFDDEKLDSEEESEQDFGLKRLRLAAQNWDRPIIVTTAVQFFESLFDNRPSRCRKLHNIARSVVILDEAQTLPLKLLRPCLAALNELARGYRSSIVLCTATQPAVRKPELEAPEALQCVREIVAPGRDLYGRLKRVQASIHSGTLSDDELLKSLSKTEQGLIIVNNRRHARELLRAMSARGIDGTRHLTTAMTAAHRQRNLASIRDDLAEGRLVRLVSTSLIEAGVDISFKAVWRAWAGLDQIVQAAGRCNRNGELGPEGGRLIIFAPEEKEGRATPPELKQNSETAIRVMRDRIDLLSPEAINEYFRELLWTKQDGGHWRQLDNVKVGEQEVRGIAKAIAGSAPGLNFLFADIAQAFRIIDETMVPVIIPESIHSIAGANQALIDSIAHVKSFGGVQRSLQRHIVQVPRKARDELVASGSASAIARERLGEQFVVLCNEDLYDDEAGLNWDNATYRKAESLIW